MAEQNAYAALGGVDYRKMAGFKAKMQALAEQTKSLCLPKGVIVKAGEHGGEFELAEENRGRRFQVVTTIEGLGNKNIIAEIMYRLFIKTSFHRLLAQDVVNMAANDVAASGADPFMLGDEITAGTSDWFADDLRSGEFAQGLQDCCEEVGMAVGGGESASCQYLVNRFSPNLPCAPVLSACVSGIIWDGKRISTKNVKAGDRIIGARSSGFHSNGSSLIIASALALHKGFLTRLGDGRTLGEHASVPTLSYAKLVRSLISEGVQVNGHMPGTGGGVAKICKIIPAFTHRITEWPKPYLPLFEALMKHCGISIETALKTFNMNVGWYVFASAEHAPRVIEVGNAAGYSMHDLGFVEEGKRQVVFGPENDMILPPPEE